MWHADMYGLFDSPKVTSISTMGAPNAQICTADPERVLLMIANPSGGLLSISPLAAAPGGTSFTWTVENQPVIFTFGQHGLLSQIAWFITPDYAGFTVMCLELFMRRKPKSVAEQYDDAAKLRAATDDSRIPRRRVASGNRFQYPPGWPNPFPGSRG